MKNKNWHRTIQITETKTQSIPHNTHTCSSLSLLVYVLQQTLAGLDNV